MFVNVLLNTSVSKLNKLFTYLVPIELEKDISIGKRVLLPFGRGNRQEVGMILSIADSIDFDKRLIKSIIKVIDEEPIINDFSIKLAKWIAKRYICNLSDSINLFFPPGVNKKNIEVGISKTQKYVYLLDDCVDTTNFTSKRKEIFELLCNLSVVSLADLKNYFNISNSSLNWFKKNELIEIKDEEIFRDPFKNYDIKRDEKRELIDFQQNAYNEIIEECNKGEYQKILLHGLTGSGKTEVYLQIIEEILNKGKNVIVLVPEISLTPQTVGRFLSRFGNIVAVLHSKLSIGERIDEYNKIASGEIRIVIGARSAIFASIKDIGLIIIDEEQDNAYKSETTPKYDTLEVAEQICKYNKSVLVLGTATPSINSYYEASIGKAKLVKMDKRVSTFGLPNIKLVDLISNGYVVGSKSITQSLFNEIQKNIQNKEQTILFLNKRGYCSSIICKNCGYVFKCKNCDVSYTYHNDKKKLICHYCGSSEVLNKICPECGNNEFDTNILGTQKVEIELQKLFPSASIIRMDKDTTNKKDGHLEIINKFKNENIDIMIGTQMIAKGHDFPNVTLVGVLNSDASLYLQDYRANELTFNLLTQVAGRAGRSNKIGRVIFQTYQVNNKLYEYVQNNDYLAFYNSEINYRKLLRYPPFCDIIQIVLSSTIENAIIDYSEKLYNYLKQQMNQFFNKEEVMIYKAMPAMIGKIDKQYRYKINIKCKYTEAIAIKMKEIMNSLKVDKNVKIGIYVNSNQNM